MEGLTPVMKGSNRFDLRCHDRPGIVSMCNAGRHTNETYFFICLDEISWAGDHYVMVGQVVT
ncbi:unnamed protein product [Arabis nemorensis]|uniref:Peptidyl-prolyl cis-trans isomerase n=1 Tax=Arabis nemorensis TaxID=586526 RepID=A0A565CLY8_9BRAS|nr:unnamed protein product [Arabis nemorensis]